MTAPCVHEVTTLLPAFALDAVEDSEREMVRAHIAECMTCALEVVGLREAATVIDEGQPEPRAEVWSRVVGTIRARKAPSAPDDDITLAPAAGASSGSVRTRLRIGAPTSADVDLLRLTSKASHELLWIQTPEEAAAIVANLVRALGADVVGFSADDRDCIPIDISFGAGAPVFPAAPRLSISRIMVEEALPAVVEDARRAIALSRARRRRQF